MNFDVVIIGAGPAGLNAALVAAQAGVSVAIVDENAAPGGQVWRRDVHRHAKGRARETIDAVLRFANVRWLTGTRLVQVLAPGRLLLEDAQRGFTLDYGWAIVATGARERFLPYPGWTLPGVTGAGGLQALIKGGVTVKGERIVIAGSGPLLWAAAMTAHAHGARIEAIVEHASPGAVQRFGLGLALTPDKLMQAVHMRFALRHTPYLCGAHVERADGDEQVTQVSIRQGDRVRTIECDRLACAFGLVPNVKVGAAFGCATTTLNDAPALAVDEWQATSVADVYAAGECTGVGGMELSAVEGRIAAWAALGQHEAARQAFAERERFQRFAGRLHDTFAIDASLTALARPDTLFCRCEDVTFGEVSQHRSWREAKLQTRCGMGPCQGNICGEAAVACFGWPRDDQRPPLAPARIGTLMAVDSPA